METSLPRVGLTRYFVAYEIAEKCKGIVECNANILGTRGLETNGGVDTACFAVDICRHKIICNALDLFAWTKAHSGCFKQSTGGICREPRVATSEEREQFRKFAAGFATFQDLQNIVTYGKQSGSIQLQCSYQPWYLKHQ